MTSAYLQELSLLFLGSSASLLISALRNESVNQRYGIGAIMLIASFILFVIA